MERKQGFFWSHPCPFGRKVSSLASRFLPHTACRMRGGGRAGFTLIEILIFAAIFAVVAVTFTAILVSTTKVQVRQSAVAEVNQQSQFLLQSIQTLVGEASLIDIPTSTPTSTLKLHMPTLAADPTLMYLSNGTAYLTQASGAAQALTSDRVTLSNLTFTRLENPPGHDTVSVSFTMAYNTSNTQQQFSQGIETAIARVSAATFDSNIVPSSNNTLTLGVSQNDWKAINNTLFFSGMNVGIGVSSPHAMLEISGGDIYVDTTANGLILRDSGGGCWRLGVNASGTVSGTSMTCP